MKRLTFLSTIIKRKSTKVKSNIRISGVYCIYNVKTKYFYVGSSRNIYKRMVKHFRLLRIGEHWRDNMLKDYNKFGRKSFKFYILQKCSEEKMKKLEKKWIDFIDNSKKWKTYNIYKETEKIIWPESSLLRLSESAKKNWESREYREKMSKVLVGSHPKFWKEEVKLKRRKFMQFLNEWENLYINEGFTTLEIAKRYKCSINTVGKYLKNFSNKDIKLIKYRGKKVKIIKYKKFKIFDSIVEASKFLGVDNSHVGKCIKNNKSIKGCKIILVDRKSEEKL
jgi:group I intron endonuclease